MPIQCTVSAQFMEQSTTSLEVQLPFSKTAICLLGWAIQDKISHSQEVAFPLYWCKGQQELCSFLYRGCHIGVENHRHCKVSSISRPTMAYKNCLHQLTVGRTSDWSHWILNNTDSTNVKVTDTSNVIYGEYSNFGPGTGANSTNHVPWCKQLPLIDSETIL